MKFFIFPEGQESKWNSINEAPFGLESVTKRLLDVVDHPTNGRQAAVVSDKAIAQAGKYLSEADLATFTAGLINELPADWEIS